MKLDWRATAPGMREVYGDFSRALAGGDFYLAGGTALALPEGHRVSVDHFVEADDVPPLKLLESIPWEQVKTDLRAAVAALL